MSTSSTRRMKDRDGGDGGTSAVKVAAPRSSRSLTPASSSDKIPSANALRKLSAEKENRRSTSRGAATAATQRPTIRPMPRVDKASLVRVGFGSDSRERKSTSSVPRGRSSSPSDFTKVLSDTRKDRRVSVDRVVKGSVAEPDRSAFSGSRGVRVGNQAKGYRDLSIKGSAQVGSRAKLRGHADEIATKSSNSDIKSRNGGVMENKVGESENNKSFVKSSSVHDRGDLQIYSEKVDSESELKNRIDICIGGHRGQCSTVLEKTGKDINSCFTEVVGKSAGKAKVLEIPKEKESGDDCSSRGLTCKYPSRLHEKLAFLEGKVKRIASDIRRTKEMLDLNNPDQSKVILSDIQDKISGIEKAIDHVASDSNAKIGILKSNANDDKEPNMVVDSQNKKVDKGKRGARELSSEELETRLFPHRKLLQNRTSNKASLENCPSNESTEKQDDIEETAEEKVLSPIEETKIAQEFLANLNKEAGNVKSRDGEADMKYCGVKETGGDASAKTKDSSSAFNQECDVELLLTTDEKLEEFDDQENRQGLYNDEETEDDFIYSLNDIGNKTAVGGWFVSEGEAVLIAHDDGSCSYYDIANREVCKPLQITSH